MRSALFSRQIASQQAGRYSHIPGIIPPLQFSKLDSQLNLCVKARVCRCEFGAMIQSRKLIFFPAALETFVNESYSSSSTDEKGDPIKKYSEYLPSAPR